jgi:hypothetical protein
MSTILAIFILVLFISCGDNRPQQISDNSTYNSILYLTDRTVCENTLSTSGQLLNKKQTTYFYQYDAINGDRVYDSVISFRYYEYDKDNNSIHELEYDRPKDNKLKPRYEIIRTFKDSLLLTENEYEDGTLIRYRVHIFDKENRELKRTIFRRIPPKDSNMDDIISKTRWSYDTTVSTYKYNASGQLILVEHYTNSNNLVSKTVYSYTNGELHKQIETNKRGDTLSITILGKNDNLELRVANIYELNCIDSSWRKNEVIYKMVNYQKDKKQLMQTIYQYDKFGNETESTTKKNYR